MLRGAKGLSAEHVYILRVCKDALSGERRDEYPGHACQALLPSFLGHGPYLSYDGGLALVMARQIPSRRSVTRHGVG